MPSSKVPKGKGKGKGNAKGKGKGKGKADPVVDNRRTHMMDAQEETRAAAGEAASCFPFPIPLFIIMCVFVPCNLEEHAAGCVESYDMHVGSIFSSRRSASSRV